MPISDAYVVQYLLQLSRAQNPLIWKINDSDGFKTTIRGVQVDLECIPTRTGSYLNLTLSIGDETIQIAEPPRKILGSGYKTEDHRQLASLMQELAKAARQQCIARENRVASVLETVRQSIYRQLMGMVGPEG